MTATLDTATRRSHTWIGVDTPCTYGPYRESQCPVCDGGLSLCSVCGGMEGSLTTDCSGERIGGLIESLVYTSGLDYFDGAWTWSDGPLERGPFSMHGKSGSIDKLIEYAERRIQNRLAGAVV